MNDHLRAQRWWYHYPAINEWIKSTCFGGGPTNKHNDARKAAAKARILKRKRK